MGYECEKTEETTVLINLPSELAESFFRHVDKSGRDQDRIAKGAIALFLLQNSGDPSVARHYLDSLFGEVEEVRTCQ